MGERALSEEFKNIQAEKGLIQSHRVGELWDLNHKLYQFTEHCSNVKNTHKNSDKNGM